MDTPIEIIEFSGLSVTVVLSGRGAASQDKGTLW